MSCNCVPITSFGQELVQELRDIVIDAAAVLLCNPEQQTVASTSGAEGSIVESTKRQGCQTPSTSAKVVESEQQDFASGRGKGMVINTNTNINTATPRS